MAVDPKGIQIPASGDSAGGTASTGEAGTSGLEAESNPARSTFVGSGTGFGANKVYPQVIGTQAASDIANGVTSRWTFFGRIR